MDARSGLEDLIGDLTHARRAGDMSRLALLCYCEVRRWSRIADEKLIAEHSAALITDCPPDRRTFLCRVDGLIEELQQASRRLHEQARA
jgi:hypothetical protein